VRGAQRERAEREGRGHLWLGGVLGHLEGRVSKAIATRLRGQTNRDTRARRGTPDTHSSRTLTARQRRVETGSCGRGQGASRASLRKSARTGRAVTCPRDKSRGDTVTL